MTLRQRWASYTGSAAANEVPDRASSPPPEPEDTPEGIIEDEMRYWFSTREGHAFVAFLDRIWYDAKDCIYQKLGEYFDMKDIDVTPLSEMLDIIEGYRPDIKNMPAPDSPDSVRSVQADAARITKERDDALETIEERDNEINALKADLQRSN